MDSSFEVEGTTVKAAAKTEKACSHDSMSVICFLIGLLTGPRLSDSGGRSVKTGPPQLCAGFLLEYLTAPRTPISLFSRAILLRLGESLLPRVPWMAPSLVRVSLAVLPSPLLLVRLTEQLRLPPYPLPLGVVPPRHLLLLTPPLPLQENTIRPWAHVFHKSVQLNSRAPPTQGSVLLGEGTLT